MAARNATRTLYQLKAVLVGVSPPLWRRVLVSSKMKLGTLHAVLQVAFGWNDCHLHQFEAGGKVWGSREMEQYDELPMGDEDKVTIGQVLRGVGGSLLYTYDFGDDWRHKLTLERVIPDPAVVFPDASCLTGKRGSLQEDCGGPWGYGDLVAILKDPSHEEYSERREWAGENFDPERFDLIGINSVLKTIKV